MGNLLDPSLFLYSPGALGYARSHHSPAVDKTLKYTEVRKEERNVMSK